MKLFKILAATAITFGASSVWADLIREDSTACSPTIHLKVPATWINAFISLGDRMVHDFTCRQKHHKKCHQVFHQQ